MEFLQTIENVINAILNLIRKVLEMNGLDTGSVPGDVDLTPDAEEETPVA